jgi:hypothetical protein
MTSTECRVWKRGVKHNKYITISVVAAFEHVNLAVLGIVVDGPMACWERGRVVGQLFGLLGR